MAKNGSRADAARKLHVFSFTLGVWLILSPFILGYDHTVASINSVVIGVAIACLSYFRLRTNDDVWVSWALAGMGLWLVFSPFIFGYVTTATYWNELLFGIALIVAMVSGLGQSIRHHSHLVH